MNYLTTANINDWLGLVIHIGLMVGLFVLTLRILVAFIRPGGNVNTLMGMSVGIVLGILAAQYYARAYDGHNDVIRLGILLGGLLLNLFLLTKAYEGKQP